jgi:V/A-type H+-transporting ATPase subunit K
MLWFAVLMTLSVVALIALGVYLDAHPVPERNRSYRWLKRTVGSNLLLFALGLLGILFSTVRTALAQQGAPSTAQISVGTGLAMIGIGIPTAIAAIGAGLAVSSVGAAALGVIAEKPEAFGRTLVYLGLAEGIAVYGLVVTILMLNRI